MENTENAMGQRDNRADMMRLLLAERLDIDVTDENAVFGQIIDDYADYARLLEDERGRREQTALREQKAAQSRASLASGQSPELAEAAFKWLDDVAAAVGEGNYSERAFGMAVKAMNYDRDVKEAELRGRNARIRASVMPADRTDGVPRLGTSAPAPATPPSIFDIARG